MIVWYYIEDSRSVRVWGVDVCFNNVILYVQLIKHKCMRLENFNQTSDSWMKINDGGRRMQAEPPHPLYKDKLRVVSGKLSEHRPWNITEIGLELIFSALNILSNSILEVRRQCMPCLLPDLTWNLLSERWWPLNSQLSYFRGGKYMAGQTVIPPFRVVHLRSDSISGRLTFTSLRSDCEYLERCSGSSRTMMLRLKDLCCWGLQLELGVMVVTGRD